MNDLTNHSLVIQTCWSISASLDGAEKMAFLVKQSGITIVSGLSSAILIRSSARPLCCSGIHTSSSTGYSCTYVDSDECLLVVFVLGCIEWYSLLGL